MAGQEMVRFINQLSSSSSEQSMSGNYGVGAKITAATRNHYGVVYCSWKNGEGAMIRLLRDPTTGQYGLKQWERADGTFDHYVPIEDEVKPSQIGGHGTKVVLLGNTPDEDTMRPPEGAQSPSRWISKYLNGRYFRFPNGIVVRAREGWEYPRNDKDRNYLRRLTGQQHYLNEHAECSGRIELKNATTHWWILKDEPAVGSNSGFVESAGHMAALYQDELYELATARAGMARLQQFGVTFGYRWVVIYVEPLDDVRTPITTNTSRTALLVGNEILPWAEWALEFREKMPQEVADHVERHSGASASTDHSKSIRDRLKDLLDLYQISRYKPGDPAKIFLDEDRVIRVGPSTDPISTNSSKQRSSSDHANRHRERDGGIGNVYSLFEKKGGTPGIETTSDPFPQVRWVTLEDGSREFGAIEDRAAKYLDEQNLLLLNGDFRVFTDMMTRFGKEFGGVAGAEETIKDVVRSWFEQALVETVMGVHALRRSKEWDTDQIAHALSQEALTAAVMQRYHIFNAVKRHLRSRFSGAELKTASG